MLEHVVERPGHSQALLESLTVAAEGPLGGYCAESPASPLLV